MPDPHPAQDRSEQVRCLTTVAALAALVSLAGVVHLLAHAAAPRVVLPSALLAIAVVGSTLAMLLARPDAGRAWSLDEGLPVRSAVLHLVVPAGLVAVGVAGALDGSGAPLSAEHQHGVAAALSVVGPAVAVAVSLRRLDAGLPQPYGD